MALGSINRTGKQPEPKKETCHVCLIEYDRKHGKFVPADRDRTGKVLHWQFRCFDCDNEIRASRGYSDRYGKGTDTEGYGHVRSVSTFWRDEDDE